MNMLRPNIFVLKEGTENHQGKDQIISNINACQAIVEVVKTTLGPRGMDKMICSESSTTITNDGATVIKLLEIQHPAAKSLSNDPKAQDNEVGDGTTSVLVLSGELLKEAKQLIEDGMNPQVIIHRYKEALDKTLQILNDCQISTDKMSQEEKRNTLVHFAKTSLNSKLIAQYKNFFGEMVVNAVEKLDTSLDKSLIGINHETGGSITDSFLVDGVAFKKTFSYAGFEQQPKKFTNPKIIILNVELELKAEKENEFA